MALPTTSLSSLNDDEEIIDLTDIVEKGSVPGGAGSARNNEHSLESQMADLLNGGAEAEAFDLDALLKESGLDGDAAEGERGPADDVESVEFDAPDTVAVFPEEMPSAGAGRHSDAPAERAEPDAPSPVASSRETEGEDMPDLGDVDALLRDLLPPEQPSMGGASGKAAPAASEADTETEEVDEDDLDSLLASLDNVAAKPEKAPQPTSGDEDDDLDSLLNSIMNSDPEKPKQAVARPAPAMVEGDELADLLKAAMAEETRPEGEVEQASVPEGEVEHKPENKDDEIADLLKAAMVEERQPVAKSGPASGPEEKSEGGDNDFEDLMKSIMSEEATADKAPASDKEEADDFDDLMKSLTDAEESPAEEISFPSVDVAEVPEVPETEDDGLDALLNTVMPDAEKLLSGDDAPTEAKTVKAGLDALLNSVQADMEAQVKPINPKIAAASLDELDALIAGLEAEEEARPEVSPEEREQAMSALLEALGSPGDSLDKGGMGMAGEQKSGKAAGQANDNKDFAAALAAEMTTREPEAVSAPADPFTAPFADGAADEALAFDAFSSVDKNGIQDFAPGGSLDDLDQILASVVASQSDIHAPSNAAETADAAEMEEFPLESDLGDPLLVDETTFVDDSESTESDLGTAVLQSLESLATEIAGLQERMENFSVVGAAQDSVVLLQTQMEHIQAEVRDMSEGHAEGLAAAEARVSVLEAELAERAAGEGDLVPRLEGRIVTLEASLAKLDEVVKLHAEMLASAEGKIADLEAELAATRPSGLEERMEALEAALAARAALNEEETDKPDVAGDIARLVDRVESLEIGVKNAGRLEERIGVLEADVDKAAAEAAARVIREEIAALLSDMAGTDEE